MRAQLSSIEVIRDMRYGTSDDAEHRLDVYRPKSQSGPLPGILFLHGGGFRSLTKEVYWMMAAGYAHRGYVVFLPNYRLAPRHPYPAAHEDAASAYRFALRHGADFGVGRGKLSLAGDSAGANLSLALTLACATPRPEAWAKSLFELGAMPHTLTLLSSLLQVRQPERLLRGDALRYASAAHETIEQLVEIERSYLGAERVRGFDLSDPLCLLEALPALERELPPTFSSVGRRDALLDDTYRLEAAYRKHGAPFESHVYPTAFHAFQPILWRADAQQSWRDSHAFLARQQSASTLRASSARVRVAPRVPLAALEPTRTSSRPPPPSLQL